jgi:hypothetical protein
MRDFSLPRVALLLWFMNYTFFSLVNYLVGGGHEIGYYLVYATVFMAVELMCLGWIEDLG